MGSDDITAGTDERQAIAEIIDPHSFMDIPFTDDPVLLDMVEQSKADALRKADRIIAAQSEGHVATIPDECDRIIWQGSYYHLAAFKPQPVGEDGAIANLIRFHESGGHLGDGSDIALQAARDELAGYRSQAADLARLKEQVAKAREFVERHVSPFGDGVGYMACSSPTLAEWEDFGAALQEISPSDGEDR